MNETYTTTFEDRALKCCDCREPFIWSASEQLFFAQQNFLAPRRCRTCRAAKRAERERERRAW